MTCPWCFGRLKVIDVVQTDDNRTLRKKKCDECARVIYTSESVAVADYEFMSTWSEHARYNVRKEKL